MKREELLGWIGVVLAIPPIVFMVGFEGKWAAAVFVVLVLLALIREGHCRAEAGEPACLHRHSRKKKI